MKLFYALLCVLCFQRVEYDGYEIIKKNLHNIICITVLGTYK